MKRYLLILLLCGVALMVFFAFAYISSHDGRLHIYVCDVGQGDGIIIRTPSQNLILIDGGPDESIVSCLSDHLPFWEKTIDVFVLSRPHADHFMGMFSVFPHYTIKSYVSETLVNRSSGFEELIKELTNRSIPRHDLKKGGLVRLGDGVMLRVLGPSQTFLNQTSPQGSIGESGEFASLVLLLEYKSFTMLLTGDSQVVGLEDALGEGAEDITVLHVPHHGSKTGLDRQIVDKLDPELAVISVGQNNYGHPTPEILKLLEEERIQILRTDQGGDIEIVTNGSSYWTER